MKYTAFIVAFTFSFAYGWNEGVIKFSVDDIENTVIDQLLHHKNARPGLLGYTYKNCGNPSTELLVLSNLTLGPDPLSFPGVLTVALNGVIKTTVDAPLSANLLIERKFGSNWIKIPCVGIIGSCKYDDLCDLLSGATCPPPFVTNHVPCKCPFPKGNYNLPKASFQIDAAVFPPGDYHIQANATYSNQQVACLDITATIA